MRYKYIFFVFFFYAITLQAIEVETEELPTPYVPWFTGPLLAPSGNVVPMGSINVQPYFYVIAYRGMYTPQWASFNKPIFWSYLFSVPIEFGIAPRLDFTITPAAMYNEIQGKRSGGIADTSIALSIQVLDETPYMPSIKLRLQELFPTGKYTKLDPQKLLTDGTGSGSYVTSIGVTSAKLIHIRDIYYLNFRTTVGVDLSTSTRLTGLSTFAGSPNTKGTFHPSTLLNVDIGLEYTIARNWAWALDILYTYATPSTFSGENGQKVVSTVDGLLGIPSSEFSLAPALEYSWSESLGLIAGCWFSIAGSNCFIFRNGIVSLNYYK